MSWLIPEARHGQANGDEEAGVPSCGSGRLIIHPRLSILYVTWLVAANNFGLIKLSSAGTVVFFLTCGLPVDNLSTKSRICGICRIFVRIATGRNSASKQN